MFNGSNLSELGSQLCPALFARLEGTHGLLKVGRRLALMGILVGEVKEGFREELTVERESAKLVGFPLLGVTDLALGPSPTLRKLSFCQLSL